MPIYKGSRYEYSTVDYVSTEVNGPSYPIVFNTIQPFSLLNYRTHTYTEGERLDTIANIYYSNPGHWWVIVMANPAITDFTNITPGTVLRIPSV
jgi:hypothetical protein